MDPIDRFMTERLIADRLRDTHLGDLLRMDGDSRIMDSIGGIRSEEATREYLQRNLSHWDAQGFGLWMLRLRSDNSFVGRAYVRHLRIAGNDEVAFGYALMPEFWGMGLATEIATAVVHLAFEQLGLDNLVAGVRPDNLPSRRVLEKVGARYEKDTTYKGVPHLLYRVRPGRSPSGGSA